MGPQLTTTAPAVDSQAWLRFNRCLRSLLPVPSLSALLPRLAEGWRELTDAELTFVSVVQPDARKLLGACARPGTETASYEKPHPLLAPWNAIHALPDRIGNQAVPLRLKDMESIPFVHEDHTLGSGGVVFVRHSNPPALTPLLADFADLSGRLILQALSCPKGPDATDPNSMSTDDSLRRAKLEALAEFSAGAGHEINNPLATISGRVQLLLRGESDPERRRALLTIGGQAYRIRDMIGDLMQFARPPSPAAEPLNLTDACRQVVKSLSDEAAARNCRFELHAASHVPIWADRTQLSIVIGCLLRNSMDALREGGAIRIHAEPATEDGGGLVCLSVTDHGQALSDEEREHLFDPFYSGRQAGRGLGFGLPKCYRIVRNHGGRIDVESQGPPDARTSVRIHWPARPLENSPARTE